MTHDIDLMLLFMSFVPEAWSAGRLVCGKAGLAAGATVPNLLFARRLAYVGRTTPQRSSFGGQSAGPASIADRGSEAMLFALRSTCAVLLNSGLEPFQ